MKNHWMRRRKQRLLYVTEYHDFREIFSKVETIKESMESVYLILYNMTKDQKCRIRAGKDIGSCFECSCSGFYAPDPGSMRKIRFGRFEVFEDESLEPNVLWVEREDDQWFKLVFDNLAMFVAGTWYI